MTQRRAIEKAISLLRPVHAAVAQRTPRGMTTGQADQVMWRLAEALERLAFAAGYYARAEDERRTA